MLAICIFHRDYAYTGGEIPKAEQDAEAKVWPGLSARPLTDQVRERLAREAPLPTPDVSWSATGTRR